MIIRHVVLCGLMAVPLLLGAGCAPPPMGTTCHADFCEYTEFPVPTPNPVLGTLTVGSDGALWFGEGLGNKIGRLTVDGQLTEFPVPTNPGAPAAIIPGPDGALWFVENLGNKVGRTTTGQITEIEIPTPNVQPQGLAFAPDGSLWFTERNGGRVGVLRNPIS